jgi:hypothetical protein
MNFKNIILAILGLLLFVGVSAPGAFAANATPIPCSQVGDLRDLAPNLIYYTNPNTGDQMDYVVIGDATVSSEVLVFFLGTGQILPDWPLQMITNSTYSPKIVNTLGYKKSEDGPVSLCHNYYLLLLDYPGIGKNLLDGHEVTKDDLANDVDGILQDAAAQYGISTDVVDPLGWSLGTTNALKFSLLSPVGRPTRTIHNILLIATDPGGYTNGQTSPNEASCVGTIFGALENANDNTLQRALEGEGSKLTFPYKSQTALNSGTNSKCTATIVDDAVELNVKTKCSYLDLNNCRSTIETELLNRLKLPWSLTKGVSHEGFIQGRHQGNDWAVDFCKSAGPGFVSEDCQSYGPVLQSINNGGVCKTNADRVNFPVALDCAPLTITGHIAVFNGFEDLYVQWTYGLALVRGYNSKYGAGMATLSIYPGRAGHGILYQHPRWIQDQIQAAFE